MRTRGAVITTSPGRFETMELELDDPRQGELRVKMVASGLCHSDDHLQTGDLGSNFAALPMAAGHEGSGIVEEVGPNTGGFEVGDHVVFSFLPSCGRCHWCATGHQNLCTIGAELLLGARPGAPDDFRLHTLDGERVAQMCGISTFCEDTVVSVMSAVKVPKDLPLETLCLLGCGVGTGWGSAVNAAEAGPGDTIIVMGIGGIGINAVQGAAHAGASNVIAVDPVALKRDMALKLGATHAYADIAEADELAKSLTDGQGADAAIVTIGVVEPEHVAQAFAAIRKAGTVVVTGLGKTGERGIPISLTELTLFQKRIQGAIFGASNPNADILRQVQMYRDGRLKLDELITATYTVDQVAQGYDDMRAGKNIRGVVVFG
jgi:S-(hydroxymethyl)glutathione dehydrogenase/alcohol dehydrogenase